MKLRCVIIDDESDAIKALKIMITDFSGEKAEVVGVSSSVQEGTGLIINTNPDVVFLDIQMPGGGGFKIAEAFPTGKFKLVFVTAYDQYAIRALKMKAEDYLMKPVDPEELEKLISKLWSGISSAPLKIKIPTKNSVLFVDPSDILYIKGDGRYSEIFLKNSVSHVVTRNIGLYESELEKNNFLRIHKSYLANIQHISKLLPEDKAVFIDGSEIEISRRKKPELKLMLERRSKN
jgi:two-component system, LytTR family, response regulator